MYEAFCFIMPNINEENIDVLISKFEKKIKENGGEMEKVEKQGIKKLPFVFGKHKRIKEALLLFIKFKGDGKTVTALKDMFRIQEEVIRHLIARAKKEAVQEAEAPVVFPEMEKPSGQP
ncbi:MAG: hypothetical protein FD145_1543 [Candidatus Saganbacteria bacterium]|uniref:Small ribosomal subunit protein bS6 n=1 Tax=Candidatus Saganbacteria bacterium TaxID=2575572 RepID=A0A833KZP7_UNCSA|nr:MAG: hypothetical protein FD145_1543 [Candidatus Saganbacteria bacterium]